jgi:hypothetical protein
MVQSNTAIKTDSWKQWMMTVPGLDRWLQGDTATVQLCILTVRGDTPRVHGDTIV